MTGDPVRTLLGVGTDASPEKLLGLADEHASVAQIEAAMRLRIGQTFRHRMGRTPEADRVRQMLRDAARSLIERQAPAAVPERRTGDRGTSAPLSSPVPPLSNFDRAVLGVLVSHGGWNASSRSRLIAVAGQHKVTPDQLLSTIAGLNNYARAGRRRIEISQLDPERAAAQLSPTQGNGQMISRIGDGSMRDPAWRTIQFSVITGLVLIFAGIISVRTILYRQQLAGQESQVTTVAQSKPPKPAELRDPAPPQQRRMNEPRQFRTAPTFLGNGLPAEATALADQTESLEVELESIVNHLIVSGEDVSDATLRNWDVTSRDVATVWPLLSMSQRNSLEAAMLKALMETRHLPEIGNRMLHPLTPSATLAEPLDVWRGAWMAGMLARIARNPAHPDALRTRADDLLSSSLQNAAGDATMSFDAAARAWLDDRVEALVEMTRDRESASYDYWELWMTALRKLDGREGATASMLQAVRFMLRQPTGLLRNESAMNVLGRLVTSLDFNAALTRDSIAAMFIDEQVSSAHLQALTNVLAASDEASWFSDELIIPGEADMVVRRRLRDRALAAWPSLADSDASVVSGDSNPLRVDEELAARWYTMANDLLASPRHLDNEKLVHGLVAAAALNEAAAAIVARETAHAEYVMEELQRSLLAPSKGDPPVQPSRRRAGPRVGQTLGADGKWAEQLESARRNPYEQLELLRSLAGAAGTDLGPLDAEALVRELFRGASQEIRQAAQDALLDRFDRGPTVVLTFLDEFPNAPRTAFVSETIQRLTGRNLPHYRVEGWRSDARLALVEHMLSLQDVEQRKIDAAIDPLTRSYSQQLAFLRRESVPSTAPSNPETAAELLCAEWLNQISQMMVRDTESGTIDDIRRRSATREGLARGPLQQFIARQLCVLDCLVYAASSEQPSRAAELSQIVAARAKKRVDAMNVLVQAWEIEETMLLVWTVRMGVDRFAKETP